MKAKLYPVIVIGVCNKCNQQAIECFQCKKYFFQEEKIELLASACEVHCVELTHLLLGKERAHFCSKDCLDNCLNNSLWRLKE